MQMSAAVEGMRHTVPHYFLRPSGARQCGMCGRRGRVAPGEGRYSLPGDGSAPNRAERRMRSRRITSCRSLAAAAPTTIEYGKRSAAAVQCSGGLAGVVRRSSELQVCDPPVPHRATTSRSSIPVSLPSAPRPAARPDDARALRRYCGARYITRSATTWIRGQRPCSYASARPRVRVAARMPLHPRLHRLERPEKSSGGIAQLGSNLKISAICHERVASA